MAGGKKVFYSGGLGFNTSVPPAWGQKCEQTVLGVGGVFEGGGISPVDSAVVDVLQRGQWTPGDLLHSL